jgi:hypothetical protein
MIEQLFNDDEFSLLRLVPMVLRARDFRLYTRGGRRLVDLWQNGGAAILGHTPPSLLREIKNTAGRGLYVPFPHFLENRYRAALSRIFPDKVAGRDFRLYAAPPPQLYTLVATESGGPVVSLWRPFLDPAAPLSVPENASPVLIPVVPGIQGWRGGLPLGLCALAIRNGFESPFLPPGDFLPPVLLAAATRGIYDLIAAAPERANPAYRRIDRVFKIDRQGSCRWQRQGLYLSLKQATSDEEWAALFRRFLDNGFLLPPVRSQPVILPGILSPGEEAKLAELLAD